MFEPRCPVDIQDQNKRHNQEGIHEKLYYKQHSPTSILTLAPVTGFERDGCCETKTAQPHSVKKLKSKANVESNAAAVHKPNFHTSLVRFQASAAYQSALSETSAWFVNEILAGKPIELWEVESHFFTKEFKQHGDDIADLQDVIRLINEQIKKEASQKNQNKVNQDMYNSYDNIVEETLSKNENYASYVCMVANDLLLKKMDVLLRLTLQFKHLCENSIDSVDLLNGVDGHTLLWAQRKLKNTLFISSDNQSVETLSSDVIDHIFQAEKIQTEKKYKRIQTKVQMVSACFGPLGIIGALFVALPVKIYQLISFALRYGVTKTVSAQKKKKVYDSVIDKKWGDLTLLIKKNPHTGAKTTDDCPRVSIFNNVATAGRERSYSTGMLRSGLFA